jgi:hypothetical protein
MSQDAWQRARSAGQGVVDRLGRLALDRLLPPLDAAPT